MEGSQNPVLATLAKLAKEHLQTMSKSSWDDHAKAIRERAAAGRPSGDTYGCVIDGRHFDVGDSQMWVASDGSDIKLVSYAVTPDADEEIEYSATTEMIVPRG